MLGQRRWAAETLTVQGRKSKKDIDLGIKTKCVWVRRSTDMSQTAFVQRPFWRSYRIEETTRHVYTPDVDMDAWIRRRR